MPRDPASGEDSGQGCVEAEEGDCDTTQRKAKQGDKEYVHNYGPVDRVKKRQRDADYYEDVPEDKKSSTPTTGARRRPRAAVSAPKRPIGMEPSRFVRGYCSPSEGRNRRCHLGGHDALASYGRAMARRHHIAQRTTRRRGEG